MLKCPNCNAENQDTARFCYACGTMLEAPKPAEPVAEPTVAPAPEQPVYQQPEQPIYQQPVQEEYTQQGSYQQNAYQQPQYQQPQYQQPIYQQPPQEPAPIKNWMVANIITAVLSLLCCSCTGIITGIIGIVFSAQVNTKLRNGDPVGAQNSSNTAKVMFIVTLALLILSLIVSVIYMILAMTGAVSSAGMYALEDMFY